MIRFAQLPGGVGCWLTMMLVFATELAVSAAMDSALLKVSGIMVGLMLWCAFVAGVKIYYRLVHGPTYRDKIPR